MKGGHSPMSTLDGRVASLETAVSNQVKMLEDFARETRANTESLFTGLRKVTEAVQAGRATNWQQLGVLFSLVSLASGFLYVAFLAPLQREQDRERARFERHEEVRLEQQHEQALRVREIETWLKARRIIPN